MTPSVQSSTRLTRSLCNSGWLALLLVPWMACIAGGPAETRSDESRDDGRSLFRNKGSHGSEDFLPPDEAFQFTAALEADNKVKLEWVIAPGYYLYKERLHLDSPKEVQLGAPQLPHGKLKHDENFGDTEVYYEVMAARVPVRQRGAGRELNFTVTYQGCAEAGLCYNPIVKQVALTLPTGATATTATGDSSKQIRDTHRPSSQPASGSGKKSHP